MKRKLLPLYIGIFVVIATLAVLVLDTEPELSYIPAKSKSHQLTDEEMKVALEKASESRSVVEDRRNHYKEIASSWRENEEALQARVESTPRLIAMAHAAEYFAVDGDYALYFQFIDQFNKVVPDVKVFTEMGFTTGYFYSVGPTTGRFEFTADSQGRAKIEFPGKGGVWGISIHGAYKEGYQFKQPGYSLRFGTNDATHNSERYYKGTKEKPRIIKMWKIVQPAEEMTHSKDLYGLLKQNQSYTIDIIKGKKYEGVSNRGDLVIEMQRDEPDPSYSKSVGWSYTISVVDGGLIEADDIYQNEAPEDGYQPTWTISQQIKNPHKLGISRTKKFYVKSRGGVYSKVYIEFIPYYRKEAAVVEVNAWTNPKRNSRNLFYDQRKRVYPGD